MGPVRLRKASIHLILFSAVALLLVGGGWPMWPWTIGAAGIWLALLCSIEGRRELRVSVLSGLLLVLSGLYLLQLIPLGPLLELVSPQAAEIRRVVLGHRTGPVTLEWGATAREASRTLALAAVAAVAGVEASRWGQKRIIGGLRGAVTLSVGVAALHGMLGMSHLFGWTHWSEANQWNFTTLINPNHSAILLVVGALVWQAHPGPPANSWRQVASAVPVGLGLTLAALQGSRGGVAAAAMGAAFCTILLLPPVRRMPRKGPVVLTVGVVCAVLSIGAAWRTGFDWRGDPKFGAFRPSMELIRDYFWVGTGRGAFGSVFPAYNYDYRQLTFYFPENLVLQFGTELGVSGIALALFILASVVLHALKLRSSRKSLLAGALILLIWHDLVDFALEIPAMATIAVLLAVGIGLGSRTVWRLRLEGSMGRRAVQAALTAGMAALLVSAHDQDLEMDLASMASHDHPAAIEETARRHPANPFVWSRAAHELEQLGHLKEALEALNAALLLGPHYPDVHLMAARLLHDAGFETQARASYQKAWSLDGTPARVGPEVLASYHDLRELRQCLPTDPERPLQPQASTLFWVAEELLAEGRREAAAAWVDWAQSLELPAELLPELARLQVATGRVEAGLEALQVWLQEHPNDLAAWRAMLRASRTAHRNELVARALNHLLMSEPKDPDILMQCVLALAQLERYGEARSLVRSIREGVPPPRWRRLDALQIRLALDAKEGEVALRETEHFLQKWPAGAEIRILRARALLLLGRRAEAHLELELANRIEPGHPGARRLRAQMDTRAR